MPSELITGRSRPQRDPTLSAAYWVLIAVAIAELIAAAVGLAPRIASSVRKAQGSQGVVAAVSSPLPSAPVPAQEVMEQSTGQSSDSLAPKKENSSTATPSADFLSSDRPLRQDASPDSPSLEILSVKIEANQDGSKVLQIATKARLSDPIDVPQVKVQVYFYDEENGEISPSKAQVTSRWLSAPVDWKNGKPELLEVSYLSDSSDPDLHFAGYVIAIYYKGELQDCRSEPNKLRKLFEPKYFIGLDEQ